MAPKVKETSPEVEALYAELEAVSQRIDGNKGEAEGLYAERLRLFELLVAAGERQAEIARRAGLTRMAVNFAMKKDG